MRFLAILLLGGLAAGSVAAQTEDVLQLGLRMSAEYSMQWDGGRIYLEGRSHEIFETQAKRIHEVWPGSVRGSYSIWFDDSVGLLLGDRIVPAGPLFGEGALLRSGRYELVTAATTAVNSNGSTETRFVEWRSVTLKRQLAVIPGAITDFDVDASSRLLYLTKDGKLYLVGDKPPGAEVPLPKMFTGKPERVFLDAISSEIVVYGGKQVARLVIKDGTWTIWPFDTKTQALVRHAASRRVRPEDRFRETKTRTPGQP
jgi:hypothetical protein